MGVLVGLALAGVPVYAYRMEKPGTIHEWNSNTFAQLNNILLQLWNITNGRVAMDVVTADPDGSRPCNVGEEVLYDTGTDQHCICANQTTKKWNCVNLS